MISKFKIDNNGFGVVELIMVIVIIVLPVLVGWIVYKDHNKKNTVVTVTKTIIAKPTAFNNTSINSQPQPGLVSYSSFSSAPTDIQNGVLVAWDTAAPGYKTTTDAICNSTSPTTAYSSSRKIWTENSSFILLAAGCDSGSVNLVAKTNGTWKDIDTTQFGLSCSTLKQYNVPTDLVKAFMTQSKGQTQAQCDDATKLVNL